MLCIRTRKARHLQAPSILCHQDFRECNSGERRFHESLADLMRHLVCESILAQTTQRPRERISQSATRSGCRTHPPIWNESSEQAACFSRSRATGRYPSGSSFLPHCGASVLPGTAPISGTGSCVFHGYPGSVLSTAFDALLNEVHAFGTVINVRIDGVFCFE